MKITIATDAWNQVNGVVRTLDSIMPELNKLGHDVNVIEPGMFHNFSLPVYHDIKIAYDFNRLRSLIRHDSAIHIMTEGPVGWAVRKYCQKNKLAFTTSYLTMFPEQFKAILGLPMWPTYAVLRRFHRPSCNVMVATDRMRNHVLGRLFKSKRLNRVSVIPKGVDIDLFRPYERSERKRPIALYVGRISAEKSIEDFLNTKIDADKVVVGDGPQLPQLKRRYPGIDFRGFLHGESLARAYSDADVFVMPSKSETFGLVMLEALACGTPVAAYPVTGPVDVIHPGHKTGCLNMSLTKAIQCALDSADRKACRDYAMRFSWHESAKCFVDNLVAN